MNIIIAPKLIRILGVPILFLPAVIAGVSPHLFRLKLQQSEDGRWYIIIEKIAESLTFKYDI